MKIMWGRFHIKGTLMQIWKSSYMFAVIWKQNPENFAFLILIILELFAREVCIFLKKRLIFNIFYCFWMFVNKLFTRANFSCAHISKTKRCFNMKPSIYHFHMKTKILADLQICISVPLKHLLPFEICACELCDNHMLCYKHTETIC